MFIDQIHDCLQVNDADKISPVTENWLTKPIMYF